MHFDGARLWESTVHLGYSPAEIAALADSTYVSFYKSLGGHSGAALAGDAELVRYARAWRHRYGGTLFQQWPAALAALGPVRRPGWRCGPARRCARRPHVRWSRWPPRP
ncbi:beta-eliminating lyase-related protein [Micromonospora marina]|uniref:beta-eliminating lyase-related protein n=1 Tax=Micromonospora marina TaxID=307120 RepID=UPI0034548B6A